MVQYFPGKVPRLPETFPKCEPFNQKHSGANLNAERKLPDDNFRKFGYILRKCCSIRYCMEVAENLNNADVLIDNGAHAKVTKFVAIFILYF